MATRAPRKKTMAAEDVKKKLADAEEGLRALEKRAFAGEFNEAIEKRFIPTEFSYIENSAKDVNDIAMLEAIRTIVGIKGWLVSQSEVKKRSPKQK